jgi:hypothetical protein
MLLTTISVLTLLAGGQDRLRAQPGPDASRWAAGQPANAPPLYAEADCGNPANRAEGESEGGCIMRFRRMGPSETPAEAAARTRRAETARLGAEARGGEDDDLLDPFDIALSAAETTSRPVNTPAPAQPRCRNVFQRAESGFGGSFSRVCGDGEPQGPQLLEDIRARNEAESRNAERDCVRRPVPTDQGVQWRLVCGSPENRDRSREMLNRLMD